jgi:hypothetical protein
MMKKRAIESLKAWSEDAINCAELETSPDVALLRQHIAAAKSAGMTVDEIEALIWTPYVDEVSKCP